MNPEELLLSIVVRGVGVIIVLLVGRGTANFSRKWLARVLTRAELSDALITVLDSAIYYTIWMLAVLIVLGLLGVPFEVLVSVSALVLIVLAIALRESVGNLAATVIIMLFKPYKVGDAIETNGVKGTVREIQVFHTIIQSADNNILVLPNNLIQNSVLLNKSRLALRRVDLIISIGYADDIELAKEALMIVFKEDGRVMVDPPPNIFVHNLGNAVDLAVRPYVKNEDYTAFTSEIRQKIKASFAANGISLPYPVQDINLYTHA
ncbi:mechanosensitive ion channel family protein [Chloroflexota bacterium]